MGVVTAMRLHDSYCEASADLDLISSENGDLFPSVPSH